MRETSAAYYRFGRHCGGIQIQRPVKGVGEGCGKGVWASGEAGITMGGLADLSAASNARKQHPRH